ncbi:MAG: N-acetyl-gamma-glutamyl-phosphate reductase [Dehalococcoidia bacterium]
MVRAQIVGATGYGGLGMTELLLRHPQITITSLLAKQDVGKPVSAVYPHLRGFCDMVVQDANPDTVGANADLVIFATPDGVGQSYAKGLIEAGLRVLDYSGDFRFRSAEDYARYGRRHPSVAGKPHQAEELLAESVFGIPELYRPDIAEARLVGNPGCFAVAMILGLAPAVRAGIIDPRSIICDGKTGISGAGKKPSATHHFPERNENVTPYRIANHQHEVEASLTLAALGGEEVALTFVPHLMPITRGIIVTSYAQLRADITPAQAQELYEDMYRDEPFVRVLPAGVAPGLKGVLGSNLCDISLVVDEDNGRLVVAASIDNLLKGQAGVALQNINIMHGFP